jgi:transcriptional regulator with XRE-family HTH domain
MAVSSADVRVIVDRVCARPDVLDACTRRDLGAVISALGSTGITQGQISALTGVSQGRLSEWRTGRREPKGVSTFQKFADGVGLPAAARRALGLDPAAVTSTEAIKAADTTLSSPDGGPQATENVAALWRADLADASAFLHGR